MGKIHVYPNMREVFVEDMFVAIYVDAFDGIVLGHGNVAQAMGATVLEIHAACDTSVAGAEVKGTKTTSNVRLATLAEVRAMHGKYPVVRHGKQGHARVPTRVTVQIGASKPHHVYHQSMTEAREVWRLSQTQFSRIRSRAPGWRQLLPPLVTAIDTDVTKPKGGGKKASKKSTPAFKGPWFKLTMLKTGRVGIKYIGPSSMAFDEIPIEIIYLSTDK